MRAIEKIDFFNLYKNNIKNTVKNTQLLLLTVSLMYLRLKRKK